MAGSQVQGRSEWGHHHRAGNNPDSAERETETLETGGRRIEEDRPGSGYFTDSSGVDDG